MTISTTQKRAKRLKIVSWILLTIVPAIFAVSVLIFNFGGAANGYEEKILSSEKSITIIIPRIELLEKKQTAEDITEIFRKIEISKNAIEIDKLREMSILINNNLIKINGNIENIINDREEFKEHDWPELQIRLQRIEKTVDSIKERQ